MPDKVRDWMSSPVVVVDPDSNVVVCADLDAPPRHSQPGGRHDRRQSILRYHHHDGYP